VKLYQRRDVNKTLSSTLEVVLRQVRVLIPQSKILQREYRKRELAVPFSFWSVFILMSSTERSGSEWAGVEWDYSGIEGFDNKIGNNLGLSSCAVP